MRKRITIDGTNYSIPSGWHEVTLDHYLFYKAHEDEPVATVARLCDIPEAVLTLNPAAIYKALRSQLDWFFSTVPSDKQTTSFWFEGVKYEYVGEYTSLSLAQVLDIESWSKEFAQDPYRSYPYVVACLFTPATTQPRTWLEKLRLRQTRPNPTPYDSRAAETRGIAFHGLPLSVALPVVSFFFNRLQRLQRLTTTWTDLSATQASMRASGWTLPGTGVGNLPLTR